jgi:hypothetical protein
MYGSWLTSAHRSCTINGDFWYGAEGIRKGLLLWKVPGR